MKAKYFLIMVFFCILTFSILAESEWSEPINISNSETLITNEFPNLVLDSEGILHCVWLRTNWENGIYDTISYLCYSKSNDNGVTWTNSEIILTEDEVRLYQPKLDIDSNNNLYIAYTYDSDNSMNTQIHMIKYNGQSWSEPIIVTEEQPGAGFYYNNHIVIDNNDRIYFFWYKCVFRSQVATHSGDM